MSESLRYGLGSGSICDAIRRHPGLTRVDARDVLNYFNGDSILDSVLQNKKIVDVGTSLVCKSTRDTKRFSHVITLRVSDNAISIPHDLIMELPGYGKLRNLMVDKISRNALGGILKTPSNLEHISVDQIDPVLFSDNPIRDSHVFSVTTRYGWDTRKYRSLRAIGNESDAMTLHRDVYIDTAVCIA